MVKTPKTPFTRTYSPKDLAETPLLRSAPGPGTKRPVAPEDGKPPKAPRNPEQACGKCGAVFIWERMAAPLAPDGTTAPPSPGGLPLRAKLIKASNKCDCGFGRGRGGSPPDAQKSASEQEPEA